MRPKSELLLKSNPVHKKIPVLIHQDNPVCESLIIVEYINDTWSSSPSILPSDPYHRATARFWAAYVDDKVFAAMKEIGGAEGEEKEAAVGRLVEALEVMEEAYGKGMFFGGEEIGFVDIALGSLLGWFRVTEKLNGVELFDENKTPGLAKWAQQFSAHPAVKDVMPDTDKLAEFAMFLAKMRASAAAPSN